MNEGRDARAVFDSLIKIKVGDATQQLSHTRAIANHTGRFGIKKTTKPLLTPRPHHDLFRLLLRAPPNGRQDGRASAARQSTGLRRHPLSTPLAYPGAASPPNAATSPGSAAQLPPTTCALPVAPPSHRSILGFPHRTPSRRPLLHQQRHPAPQLHLHQRMAASINIDSFTAGCSAAGGFTACWVVSVSDAIAGCLHSPAVAAQLGLRRRRSFRPLLPLSDPPTSTPHRF
ncbi:uncharacterized protein [Triticum aestivum]|uniref:uncharacterized protein n=1 Tax=Triticum aestivum TaxID=4565 RepID=UPI001D004079|nr:uncharacterized protein LOC123187764 [Triticum aestivum]